MTNSTSAELKGGSAWVKDLSASLVVFLVALPLCMGIALASGVSPAKGLVTGIVGGVLVGALSGSPLQVSGPAAGLAVIVFELIQKNGISALGPVLIVAGAIQLIAGILNAGRWFRAISPEVIHGMLAGIGLLIVIQQFHVVLDRTPKGSGPANILAMGEAVFGGLFPINGSQEEAAAVVGITTILVMLAWQKWHPRSMKLVPGALLGIISGTLVAQIFHLSVKRVNVPEHLGDMVSITNLASFGSMHWTALLTSAVALAFIASAETLLSAAAVEQMQTRVRSDYDKELRAQGVGNLVCGLLGALPMTGVIVRSSANVHAGAETRRSTILHGMWLLLFVLALPWLLRMVPTAALAGVLVLTGIKLLNPKEVKKLWRFGWMPVAIYLTSLITIVMTNLLTGVLVGIGFSLLKLLWAVTQLETRVEAQGEEAHLYIAGMGTFLAIPKLANSFDSVRSAPVVRVHTNDLRYVDHACIELIESWVIRQKSLGIEVYIHLEQLHQRLKSPLSHTAA